jgi:hypothetical protein
MRWLGVAWVGKPPEPALHFDHFEGATHASAFENDPGRIQKPKPSNL